MGGSDSGNRRFIDRGTDCSIEARMCAPPQPSPPTQSLRPTQHHPQDEGKFGVRALLDLSLGLVAPTPEQQQDGDGEGGEASFDCPGKRTPFLLLEDVFDVLGVAQVEVRWPLCGLVSAGTDGRTDDAFKVLGGSVDSSL